MLEATRYRRFDFIEALGRHATITSDLYNLHGSTGEVILFLDDPEPPVAQKLVGEALAQTDLKLLLTVPTSETVALPNFGYDTRVNQIALEPLIDDAARTLIQSVGERLDYGLETWMTI